jgi:hypothetical protein
MRPIVLLAVLGAASAATLPGPRALAQQSDKSAEVKKLEAELAKLQAKIQDVEARLRKAREVVIAFTVKSERSLQNPDFSWIMRIIAEQNHKGGDLLFLPDLTVAVNKEARTVFVKGQPEDVEQFKGLVLNWDEFYLMAEAEGGDR